MEKYEKIRLAGRGASGTVYLYRKKSDRKLVIIKQIQVEQMTREERLAVLNEGRVLSMLQHPNIIEYYDSFLQDKAMMIVMEYAPGGTLHDYIQQRNERLFNEEEILNFFVQMLLSLQHVHSRQILHRDLKTQNILLDTQKKIVKVGDFGISKILSTRTKAMTIVGTPSYISPELCEGKAYNQKSDIWALGCILYELITLKKAFEAATLPALILKILSGTYSPISDQFSEDIKLLVASLLHLDPNRRPTICQIMAQPVVMNALANFHTDFGIIPLTRSQIRNLDSQQTATELGSFNKINAGCKTEECNHLVFFWGGKACKPTQLPNWANKVVSIATGRTQKLASTQSGRLIQWEESVEDDHCQLKFIPRLMEGLNAVNITQVVCQDLFTICLTDRGIVLSHGSSLNGCLGHGDNIDVQYPKIIESLLGFEVTKIASGAAHVMVATHDHEIFSWGCGDDGRLGLNSTDSYSTPQKVLVDAQKIQDIFCAVDCSAILNEEGAIFACGNNKFNKLWFGMNILKSDVFKLVEGKFWDEEPVRRVALGVSHAAIVTCEGKLFMSGSNRFGQIEQLSCQEEWRVEHVACGDAFTVVALFDGRVFAWGKHGRGRLGCEKEETDCGLLHHQILLPISFPYRVESLHCSYGNTMILVEKILQLN